MAGVDLSNYQGNTVGKKTVPSIGGNATIAADGHTADGNRANGVAYDSNCSVGEYLDTGAYPTGNDFGEASNPLK